MSIVIAIDGTAACGKGTLAKRLARHYGFAHLDSGALYRLVGLGVLDRGGDPSNAAEAIASARNIDTSALEDPRLRSGQAGEAASQVAAIPEVRAAVLDYQRQFCVRPPNAARGAVIDGRDIGTVICPAATAKLFVDARPEVRAKRRWLELKGQNAGSLPDLATLQADLLARDARDRARPVAPLRQAEDAILLDTSDLDIEATFAKALDLVHTSVEKALAVRPRG